MERRLAAILAADMVGYSRLMAADETGTLARQKTHRTELIDPKIAEYGGRVVKTTGDGVLVEFPSVVDALRCAVTIQLAMREREAKVLQENRIAYRVGINLGDIVVEDDDIYGDGVNVAARLEALAEPGGICVSRTVVNHVKGRVSSDFEDLGEQSVKNIPEPVHVFRVLMVPEEAGTAVVGVSNAKWWKRPVAVFAIASIGLVIVAAGMMVWRPWAPDIEPASVARMAFPLPDKPSIAVLPFTNMSDDPKQEYFVDGMIEDLITDLSKISGLFVIARNSSFSYKGQQVKVRRVAEELGVRYVLEGSVRKSSGRLRINAQLIDATTGGHVWAERYDRQLEDVFALQDEVVARIVSALQIRLAASEKQGLKRRHANSVKAYDLYLRGRSEFASRSKEGNRNAHVLFQQAIELDPSFARGYAYLAWAHARDYSRGWTAQPDHSLQQSQAMIRRANALDESSPLVQLVTGLVELDAREYEKSVIALEKALDLDPNYSDAYVQLADTLNSAGRPEASLEPMKKAMRLNPHPPHEYFAFLAKSYFSLGRYQEAADLFEKALKRNPTAQGFRMRLAATYAKLGRIEDAQWEAQEILAANPNFSVKQIAKVSPYRDPAQLERLLDGLRKAGLPE